MSFRHGIPPAQVGQQPSKRDYDRILALLDRQVLLPNSVQDSTGVYQSPTRGGGDTARRFELSSDHAPGNTTPAYPRNWSGTAWVTDTSAAAISVVDVDSEYRGRGRDEGASAETDSGGTRGKHGSFVKATFRSGQYEIDSMSRHATHISCNATANWTISATTVAVDAVTVIQPTDLAILMDDVTAVYVVHNWDGDDDALIKAEWNDSQERWEMHAADCPA